MKTKKLPLTILFGILFAAAGGNVFAGEALDQLKEWSNTTAPAGDVKIEKTTQKTTLGDLAKDTKGVTKGVGDVKATVEPPAPAPNPIKEFISENKTTPGDLAKDTKGVTKGVGDVKATVEPPAPAPNPIKEFISENKTTLFGMGLGAYLGFALFGPVGILLGAIFMLGVIKMAAA